VLCVQCIGAEHLEDRLGSHDMHITCNMSAPTSSSLRHAVGRYSYHTYGRDGARMALDAQHIRSEIIADAGIHLPIAVSE